MNTTTNQVTTAINLTGSASELYEKIAAREAVIGIVGLGYVGLPLAVEFAGKGFRTVGVDLNSEKVLRLNAGLNYIQDVNDDDLRAVVDSGKFTAEDDFASGEKVDVWFIAVPTPVTEYKDPDVSYIENAARAIAQTLHAGQLVILKSTTYPNTTEGVVQPILEEKARDNGLQLGRDYFLAFSPERIDPGNQNFTTANTPIVVGGVTNACTRLATLSMQQVVGHVHPVSSPKVAEMEKLLENTFRSINIALVNELARLCDRIGGISMWEVVEAAATKPYGFMPFFPGPGLGGHCIPIDPYYLSWLARKYDFETSFITLSAHVNEEMPHYVVNGAMRALANLPVRLSDAKVLILGVAFKKDVDDTRHSPAEKIIALLMERGFEQITIADPHVQRFDVHTRRGMITFDSQEVTDELLRSHDLVVLVTDHSAFPYAKIAEQSQMIIDTRNAFRHVPHSRDKIMLLGGGDFVHP